MKQYNVAVRALTVHCGKMFIKDKEAASIWIKRTNLKAQSGHKNHAFLPLAIKAGSTIFLVGTHFALLYHEEAKISSSLMRVNGNTLTDAKSL
jgi:hypothetical protein